MTPKQRTILLDFKAYIDRKLFEDDFDTCLTTLALDASDLIMDENARPLTAGEHGRIDLSMRLPGTPTLSKLF
jgi:hypothetical protein